MADTTCRQIWKISATPASSWRAQATGLIAGVSAVFVVWQMRARDRYTLRHLNDHYLRDIGLTRDDVMIESAKPFWRS